ncbi:MAG: glycosyltransferase family 39 protein [Chthoniobacteraceae bacterium]
MPFESNSISAPRLQGKPLRAVFFASGLALFVLCLTLFTRENRFPYFYHPDEPDKVDQIINGKWNFHHPVLLLDTVAGATKAVGATTPQQVVETGRWVSATFCALTVVALALLAASLGGPWAGVACGLALALHHQLFELSHYFKEDTAMLAGVALYFAAARAYGKRPGFKMAAFMGAAAGIAFSGKYLGAILILLALPLLFQRRGPASGSGLKHLGAFLLAMLVVSAAINLPLIEHLATFRNSFDREMTLVVEGQQGARRSVPHTLYWNIFVDNSTPLIWIGLLWYLVAFWKTRQNRSLDEWLLLIFPFAFAVLLSFSPKTNDRYFLPATAIFTVLAALGTVDLGRQAFLKVPPGVRIALGGLLLVAGQLPSFCNYYRAFQQDDRQALHEYIEKNLPKEAVIVTDDRAGLPVTDSERDAQRQALLPQKVVGGKAASDLGPFNHLAELGITHAAVSESTYGRYFLKLQPSGKKADAFMQAKAFYETLFQQGTLLWERPRGTVIYLHPGIRLYRLPTAK